MQYDIVDKWVFDIEIEAYVKEEAGVQYPVCVECSGQAPPIELGSLQDFAIFQKAIEDRDHIAHDFFVNQYEKNQNLLTEDLEKMNRKMHWA
jgi:hypothetical protein